MFRREYLGDQRRRLCEHPVMGAEQVSVRPAEDTDRRALALLFAAVAQEHDSIAAEPPIDVDGLAKTWKLDGTLVAVADGDIVGEIHVDPSWMGFGEIGMMVAAQRRSGVAAV